MYNRKKIAQARAIGYAVRERKREKRLAYIREVRNECGGGADDNEYEIARHGAKYQAWCRRMHVEPRRECL